MAKDQERNDQTPAEKKPFFSASPENSTASFDSSREPLGSQIGPYKLLSVLGEGGFGIVYLAEQHEPIRRRVALKVIKPGMDTKQAIARFEAERQALALFDHPNIARVYDAGTTKTGHPYFVMELVKGMPITEHCDQEKLNIRERLSLFLDICDGIQYAHQKGVIHRDIKPSNILVSVESKGAIPRIIDFGIAKAVSQPLTARTLYTEQGQFIGTPEYMSPEQADTGAQDIDTRSDVYSLGVVLYELLTGVLPFDPETLREAGVDRLRQIIREEEPRTPSTRLSHLGEKAVQIAAKRRTEVRTLANRLHRELEWIPMKAMRKERIRRYRSAAELADDIQNYLNGNPLIAGPESITYRLNKYIRKRRRFVAAAAIVTVSVLVGLVVSTMMYFRAEDARITEVEQKRIADEERDRAIEAEQQAQQTLANLYEEQGRKYLDSGDFDRALLFLSEAYQLDSSRESTRFLLAAHLGKYEEQMLTVDRDILDWGEGYSDLQDAPFSVSRDRRFIAILNSDDGYVRVFDTQSAKLKNQLFCEGIVQLVFAPTNKHIVVRLEGNETYHVLKALNLENGEEAFSTTRNNVSIDKLYELTNQDLPKRSQLKAVFDSICMSPDGGWFAWADLAQSEDKLEQSVRLWDFASSKQYAISQRNLNPLITALFLKFESAYGHGGVLVTYGTDRRVRQWATPSLQNKGGFDWNGDSSLFGPLGKTFAVFNDNTMRLFDRAGNRVIETFSNVAAAGYSPDERRFITKRDNDSFDGIDRTDEDPVADLWNTYDGQHVAALFGSELENWHFTPNAKCLVTEHRGGQIKVWWTEDGGLLFATPPEEHLMVTDISPDSTLLLTCTTEKPRDTKVWDLDTGDYSGLHQAAARGSDIGEGLLVTCLDRIFAFSGIPPVNLPRFNSDGSCLITGIGLLPLTTEIGSPRQVKNLVHMHVPLRLENGRLRPALAKEMLLAKWDRQLLTGRRRHRGAVNAALDVIIHEIQNGELEKSGELGMELKSWLPLESRELTDQVQNIVRQLSHAWHVRADTKERQGQYARAIVDYELAYRLSADDPDILNSLAWLQVTCPDQQLRDGQKAVENARKACELVDWEHWEYLSTYAAACAMTGNFPDAVNFQQKALDLMPITDRSRWEANYTKRLRLLRSNRSIERRLLLSLPGSNLLAWWGFDEGAGITVTDTSGNGFDGRFHGEPKWQPSPTGSALKYENKADYVTITDSSALNIADAITVVARVQAGQFPEVPKFQWLVTKVNCWSLWLDGQTGAPSFSCDGVEVPSVYPSNVLTGKVDVRDRQWHLLVAAYNGASVSLHIDGVLHVSAQASGKINVNSLLVWIGGRSEQNAGSGVLIDDVRIYDCVLTSDEIAELYNATE